MYPDHIYPSRARNEKSQPTTVLNIMAGVQVLLITTLHRLTPYCGHAWELLFVSNVPSRYNVETTVEPIIHNDAL